MSLFICGELVTLISANSLATIALAVMSETFITSICLLSCLVICSIFLGSVLSTTKVILDTPLVSVAPTEILSILNCLLCSIPVTRFKTPLLFLTVNVMIRCILSPLPFHLFLFLVTSLDTLSQPSLLYAHPQANRHMLIFLHAHVEHKLLPVITSLRNSNILLNSPSHRSNPAMILDRD